MKIVVACGLTSILMACMPAFADVEELESTRLEVLHFEGPLQLTGLFRFAPLHEKSGRPVEVSSEDIDEYAVHEIATPGELIAGSTGLWVDSTSLEAVLSEGVRRSVVGYSDLSLVAVVAPDGELRHRVENIDVASVADTGFRESGRESELALGGLPDARPGSLVAEYSGRVGERPGYGTVRFHTPGGYGTYVVRHADGSLSFHAAGQND